MLTLSLLDDFKLDENIGITGTINSGGIIGSVGGLKEKIDAAKKMGLKKVLIPQGERFIKEDENVTVNKTIDLIKYGKEQDLEIVEVSDINEALYEFTSIKFEKENYPLIIDNEYEKTMSYLALQLCNRSDKLLKNVYTTYNKSMTHNESLNNTYEQEYNQILNITLNLTNKAKTAINTKLYYSAASYCFGANVNLGYLLFYLNNAGKEDILRHIEGMDKNLIKLEQSIDRKKKKTITDLETYIIVKERLVESKDYKKEITMDNITKQDFHNLAYSYERIYSAFSWNKFFDHRGKEFNFNKDILKSSCSDKITEAEERYQYVLLFYPSLDLSNTRREIDHAYNDLNNTDYELCLFKATQAKAESNIILSVSGIEEKKITNLLNKKLEVAKKNIAKQINKGNFPILAYSYYEYANELKNENEYSALLYSEYAIELSNLDMYFKQVKKSSDKSLDINRINIEGKSIIFLTVGMVIGLVLGYMFAKRCCKKKKKGK